MADATDNRNSSGEGAGLSTAQVAQEWNGPIVANVKLLTGTLAGVLNSDTSTSNPGIKSFVGDGTMSIRGFVTLGADNTGGAKGALPIRVRAQVGALTDKNAGGGSAITIADLYKPAYGADNQTCSKLSTDGTIVGQIIGIDPSAQIMVGAGPEFVALAQAFQAGTDSKIMHTDDAQTVTAVKTFTYAGAPKINNSADTFSTQITSAATANRVTTLPDIAAGTVLVDAGAQNVSGSKTFLNASGGPKINNSADTFNTAIVSEATANRTFTLPDATGSPLLAAPITVPVVLVGHSNGSIAGRFTPGFAGKITGISASVTVPATTGAKLATFAPSVAGTPVTGGLLALTSANCTPVGAAVAGSSITALNTFTAAQEITIVASSVTAFVEGQVVVYLTLAAA